MASARISPILAWLPPPSSGTGVVGGCGLSAVEKGTWTPSGWTLPPVLPLRPQPWGTCTFLHSAGAHSSCPHPPASLGASQDRTGCRACLAHVSAVSPAEGPQLTRSSLSPWTSLHRGRAVTPLFLGSSRRPLLGSR